MRARVSASRCVMDYFFSSINLNLRMRPGCSSRVVDNGSVLFAKPPPFCSPQATKERASESGKETERERESWDLWPVGGIWESTKPLEQHTSPQILYTPPPDAPFSLSLFLFFLCLLTLWWRGASLKAQNGWNAAEQIGVLKVRSQRVQRKLQPRNSLHGLRGPSLL